MGLYENIKTICDEKGISVNKLEKDLKLPRSSIMKYNASIPSVEKIRLISEYLGTSIDAIVHADGQSDWYIDPATAKMAQEVFADPDTRMLFDAARDAKPEDIRLAA